MKKLLLAIFVAFALVIGNSDAHAQSRAIQHTQRLIWGASPFQDSLWSLDTANWSIVHRLAPTLPSFTITGITGMAQDPTTGLVYVVMKVSSVSGRVLGIIDLPTGACTQVGNLGDNFSSISFREDGQLFGMTGDGATVPETMYLIDKSNATKTVATALTAGADGEVICYNRDDNFFYHWSGNGTVVFEKVMSVAPYTATNIPTTGSANGETFGALYIDAQDFLRSTISSNFNHQTVTGNYGPGIGNNPDDLRGLVMIPSYTSFPQTACQGDAQFVMVQGTQLFDTLYFHWGDGSIDSVQAVNGIPVTGGHTYATSGTYTVHVSTGNGFGGDTIFNTVFLVNPVPGVSVGTIAGICDGDSALLVANSSSGTYQWYMNGALIAGATNSVYMAGQAGIYNMITTNGFGCADSAATGVTVVNSSYPIVSLNDTAGCASFVADAGNPGDLHLWSTGDTTQTITIMSTQTVSVIVANAANCITYDTATITINPLPVVNIGPDTTVCGSLLVDAGPFINGTYLWCDGSTTQTTTLVFSGPCAVTVTDANGCSASDTINPTINPLPVVNLGPDVIACTMAVITTDSSLAGGTFLWCDSTSGSSVLITSSSTCNLQYTDVNGCMGYDTITVTITGNPTVTANAAPPVVCADDADVLLTGSPAGGSFTGTSVTGNSFDPSVGAGTYSIIYNYTDVNGCPGSDTTSVQVNACVGIEETNAAAFSLFPNPSTGIINLNLTEAGSSVEVVDLLGNVVAAQSYNNAGAAQLDLSAQPNGVYFVRVTNGTSKEVKRVVIQK